MPSSVLKVVRRNSPQTVAPKPAPRPLPRARRGLDSLVLPFPQPNLLDRYGRVLTPLAKPWFWVPRMMPFPGIMPQMPPHDVPAVSNISFIGNTMVTANSVVVPGTDLTGDFVYLVCLALSAPALPTGCTNIATGDDGSNFYRVAYRFTTGNSETITGISGSTRTLCSTWRGVNASTPIGDHQPNTGSGTTITLPTLTLVHPTTSWVIGTMRNSSASTPSTPSGLTVMDSGNASGRGYFHGYIGPVTSFTGKTSTITSAVWLALATEIRST